MSQLFQCLTAVLVFNHSQHTLNADVETRICCLKVLSANLSDGLYQSKISERTLPSKWILFVNYTCTTGVLIFSSCTSVNCLVLSLACVHTTQDTIA